MDRAERRNKVTTNVVDTDRSHSSLPHLPLPRDHPRYPSRQQVVDYLEGYARAFSLTPHLGEGRPSLERRAPTVRITEAHREEGPGRLRAALAS